MQSEASGIQNRANTWRAQCQLGMRNHRPCSPTDDQSDYEYDGGSRKNYRCMLLCPTVWHGRTNAWRSNSGKIQKQHSSEVASERETNRLHFQHLVEARHHWVDAAMKSPPRSPTGSYQLTRCVMCGFKVEAGAQSEPRLVFTWVQRPLTPKTSPNLCIASSYINN